MEQLALLNVIRMDMTYRFRLDLPDGPATDPPECITELTAELNERLRRALLSASQYIQPLETKAQVRRNGAVDSLFSLGRLLFDSLLPAPVQEVLHHLDIPLLINSNTPDIPWELLYDSKVVPGHFLCQHLSVSRQLNTGRNTTIHRMSLSDRTGGDTALHKARKAGRNEGQGLSVLFLVNPTGECSLAEEEVATLCTTMPEAISRIILYRQQANQLEMRMRINADAPKVLHYAGPVPALVTAASNEPLLALAGSSRLDRNAASQLFQAFLRRPLVFLSCYDGSQVGVLPAHEMELLAGNLLTAGAGAVVVMRWPINMQRAREFAALFYQELADGTPLGEAMRRARSTMAQRRPDEISWISYVLYGDPTISLVTSAPAGRDRAMESSFDVLDEDQIIQPMVPSSSALDRRFLQEVLGIALTEARQMHKDYLGTPHLFIALTKLDGGCTQDALRNLSFSPRQVREVIRLALGPGKASTDTPILPTRRCKEILQAAERNAINAGSTSIDERAIAQAVLSERDGVTYELLTKMGINPSHLIELILASNAHALLELVPSVSANSAAAPVE